MRFFLQGGQWFCAGVIILGIAVEIITGAALGYILITMGSLLFALWTKLWRQQR